MRRLYTGLLYGLGLSEKLYILFPDFSIEAVYGTSIKETLSKGQSVLNSHINEMAAAGVEAPQKSDKLKREQAIANDSKLAIPVLIEIMLP
ncbi:MAG: hypothetical protein GY718_06270 [Lentisphaerae bacterium]|nr:hypothetical protein [Lentisphaerota bacterium]